MKSLALVGGRSCQVDDEDWETLSRYRWVGSRGRPYTDPGAGGARIYMARMIAARMPLAAGQDPENWIVKFKDNNPMNLTKANLLKVSRSGVGTRAVLPRASKTRAPAGGRRRPSRKIEGWLTCKQAAKRMGISEEWLRRSKKAGNTPRCVRVGRKNWYRQQDVEVWAAERSVNGAGRKAGGKITADALNEAFNTQFFVQPQKAERAPQTHALQKAADLQPSVAHVTKVVVEVALQALQQLKARI